MILAGSFAWSQLWGSPIELLAVLTGVICVALITVENWSRKWSWWNWPLGIVSSALYVKVFWNYHLYFNSLLQVFYVFQQFYGMWAWKYGGQGRTELIVNRAKYKTSAMFAVLCVFGAWALSASYGVLGVQSAAPFWDALVVTLSVTAQFVMTRKYREHWWFWMFVDIVGVWLFWSQGLYATSVLYFVYGLLVVRGIITWNRALKDGRPVVEVV